MGRTETRRQITLEGPLYVDPPGGLDIESTFGRRGPLVVDVGAARARYLTRLAPCLPDVNFLGIEVSKKRVEAALKRLNRHDITNTRMMWGDARARVAEAIAPDSVAAFTVLFPDPWPKSSHAHRRLLHSHDMVNLLASRLQPSGVLLFKTDDAAYFEPALATFEACAELEHAEDLSVITEGFAPFSLAQEQPTYYETEWRRQGRSVYQAVFRKRASGLSTGAEAQQ